MTRIAMTSEFTAVNPATADAAAAATIIVPVPCTAPHPIGSKAADMFELQSIFQMFEIYTEASSINRGDIVTIDTIKYTVMAIPRKWENRRKPTLYHVPLQQRKERA